MEKNYNFKYPAVVLGTFETGLGVIRSLGRSGVKVYSFDFKKDIGFYSKYVSASLCPHPLDSENDFIDFLINFSNSKKHKPVLFITADNFLSSITKNIDRIQEHFFINTPDFLLLDKIANKFKQYILAKNAGVPVPKTAVIDVGVNIEILSEEFNFPAIIKGLDVNSWRSKISSSIKGFAVNNKKEFIQKANEIIGAGVQCIAQEIIKGPDSNHFKYSTYINNKGEPKLKFTFQKIRQNPIYFGVGSVMESIDYPELAGLGDKLFSSIGYTGVGSAEFKLDERDGVLKLIEINARYWQQNALATSCGMNFPIINYLDVTDQNPKSCEQFTKHIKWVNIYNDFESFMSYRKLGELTFRKWLKSLKGKKVFSDYAKDDIIPGFYEIKFGKRILKLPKYLINKLKK